MQSRAHTRGECIKMIAVGGGVGSFSSIYYWLGFEIGSFKASLQIKFFAATIVVHQSIGAAAFFRFSRLWRCARGGWKQSFY